MPRRALRDYETNYLLEIDRGLVDTPVRVREAAAEYASNLISNGFPVLFDQHHLAHVTGVRSQIIGIVRTNPERFYTEFRIPKRAGGSRLITAPRPVLKKIQDWIHSRVTAELWIHDAAHGFVPGRSIASNATPHVRADVIMRLDLSNFFGSVRRREVFRAFRRIGYSRDVANLLADLTTRAGALPQGAPTSPALANFLTYRMDARLTGLAKRARVRYTRYADDLTFSGAQRVNWSRLRRAAERIVREEGHQPNREKTRFQTGIGRQVVTGVVVNEKLNWPRTRRRWIRQELHYLTKYGVDGHLKARGTSAPRYKEFIYGHVYALNSVRPDEGEKLMQQLDEVDWPY